MSTYAFFPVAGGTLFEVLGGPGLVERDVGGATCWWCFALFIVMNVVNFLLIAVDIAVVDGQSIQASFRQIFLPVLPVEIATGFLTAGVAFGYQDRNLAAVGLLAIIGLVFQHLLRTALNSMEAQGRARGPYAPARRRCRSGCSAPCCRRSRCATR